MSIRGSQLVEWKRNSAELPENWTLEKLLGEHSSRPFNPSIANVFFRAGEIEAWGRGIQRIAEFAKHKLSVKWANRLLTLHRKRGWVESQMYSVNQRQT